MVLGLGVSAAELPKVEVWPWRGLCSQRVSCKPLCSGGVAGDEGALSGAGERQHRRGGQAGSYDLGAAPRAGLAAGKGLSSCSPLWTWVIQ